MNATRATPELPGESLSALILGSILYSSVFLLAMAILILHEAASVGGKAGHLPLPVLQWAFASPVGALALTFLGALIMLPFLLLQPRLWFSRRLARAMDVTGMPVELWPTPARTVGGLSRTARWLGGEPSQRRMNLALLIVAGVVALALAVTYVLGSLEVIGVPCDVQRCAPVYPAEIIALVSFLTAAQLSLVFRFQQLRRIEANCGVWLRCRSSFRTTTLYYLRRPGVTTEAVAEALARIVPDSRVPLAQVLLMSVLAFTPLVLLLSGSLFLSVWLQLQWIPG